MQRRKRRRRRKRSRRRTIRRRRKRRKGRKRRKRKKRKSRKKKEGEKKKKEETFLPTSGWADGRNLKVVQEDPRDLKHYFLKFLFCWKSPIPKLLMREFFLEMEGDIPLPDKIRKIIFVSLGKSVKLSKAYSV